MKRIQTLILMLTFMILCGCDGNGQTVKPDEKPVQPVELPDSKSDQTKVNATVKIGEQFTLKNNESAKVKEANILITVNRIGRQWLANGGGESLDFTFSVEHGGKSKTYSHPVPDSIMAGDYKIEVVKTEPFSYGYAIFVVTKKDSGKQKDSNDDIAAKFVESFGWHLNESIAPVKVPLDVPQNFNNLPFYHYQSVSQSSGVDMTPLLGKKLEMLRYTLKEKQRDKEGNFDIYAHLVVENGKVVGAWRTDSSSRAPGIYSFVKK